MHFTTSQPQRQDANSATPSLGFITSDGLIVETVRDPLTKAVSYVHLDGKSGPVYCDKFAIPETGETFKPMQHPFFKSDTLIVADEFLNPGTSKELVNDLRSFILKYMDLPQEDADIIARYILFTWVYDKWRTVPYLRFLGPMGVGKSRMLEIVKSVSYRSLYIGAGVTEANIFRTNDQVHGTLIFDEFNLMKSSVYQSIVQILNNGINDGGVVFRNDKDYNPIPYSVFGPKILANHTNFDDAALESRMLTIVLRDAGRTDLRIELPKPSKWEETKVLRRRLLGFRLLSQDEDYPERKVNGLEIFSHRFADNFRPLFQVTGEDYISPDMISNLKSMEEQMLNTRPFEEIGTAKYLTDQWKLGNQRVYPGQIAQFLKANDVEISARAVGEILRRNNLKCTSTRSGNCYLINQNDVDYLTKVYRLN